MEWQSAFNCSSIIEEGHIKFKGEAYHPYHFNCNSCGYVPHFSLVSTRFTVNVYSLFIFLHLTTEDLFYVEKFESLETYFVDWYWFWRQMQIWWQMFVGCVFVLLLVKCCCLQLLVWVCGWAYRTGEPMTFVRRKVTNRRHTANTRRHGCLVKSVLWVSWYCMWCVCLWCSVGFPVLYVVCVSTMQCGFPRTVCGVRVSMMQCGAECRCSRERRRIVLSEMSWQNGNSYLWSMQVSMHCPVADGFCG